MAPTAHRWTSSRSASRPRSETPLAPLLLLLAAAAGCGAGAGAPCATNDECAGGLVCRGGVCLPPGLGEGDAEPPDHDAPDDDAEPGDDGAADADDDGGELPDGTDGGDGLEADDAGDADAPPPPLLGTLEPGETWDPPETAASGVLGAAGESYALVLWENGVGMWDHFDVTVTIDNGLKSSRLTTKAGWSGEPPAVPCLPGRFGDRTAVRLPERLLPFALDPLPGDTTTFRVIDPGGTSVSTVDARLRLIDSSIEIWLDETNPFGDLTDAAWNDIAGRFQTVILPRERSLFHAEPDVDGNGRVIVLVSPTVGEIGASGYVNPLDLTTSPYGNHKDMIYLNPPPDWYGPEFQVLNAAGVLAHELQHLIRAGALGTDIAESIYFNEGMSHLAADVAGFGYDNLWFLGEFLDDPNLFSVPRAIDSPSMTASTDYTNDIVLRSAGYFLLRYLFDRLGGAIYLADGTIEDAGGVTLLRDQFESSRRGIEELEWTVGASRRDFLPDWLTAMLLDGRTDASGYPLDTPPRYHFGEPYADPVTSAQHGVALNAENAYPGFRSVYLANVATTDLRDFAGTIPGGGIALLMVRPVVPGPVVAHLEAEEGADLGVRWVRLE
ncbi:MAG: hypothetical protein HY905_06180 [Deltaproteobacteria bacterium]|nr:hypothetical protein [Deltaproteobacteria bacterium]